MVGLTISGEWVVFNGVSVCNGSDFFYGHSLFILLIYRYRYLFVSNFHQIQHQYRLLHFLH